jgi:nicotinate-nucleotide pyrophosphorylase (carboxylating)
VSATTDPFDDAVEAIVRRALEEDLGVDGDITTQAVIPDGAIGTGNVIARQAGVLAGSTIATSVFEHVDPALEVTWSAHDSDRIEADQLIGTVHGRLRSILTAERSALNVLTHCSGIATLTRAYVDAAGPSTVIRDTRKTLPGLRAVEKSAVRAGGGQNHRSSLSDAILVKDNHLAHAAIDDAVCRVREMWPGRVVEVECDTLDQVRAALRARVDLILVDNMAASEVADAVALSGHEIPIEVSGGVTLDTVSEYARAGADFVSVGAITHSAPALDLALDIVVVSSEDG